MKTSSFRRITLIILVLTFVLTLSMALVACGEKNQGDNGGGIQDSDDYLIEVHPNNGDGKFEWKPTKMMPELVNEGYHLAGYYYDEQFLHEVDFNNIHKNEYFNYAIYVKWEKDKCDHQIVIDDSKLPTCIEDGLTEGQHCDICGEIIVAQEKIDSLKHDWDLDNIKWFWDGVESVVAKASCKREGCGHFEMIDAVLSDEITTAATCELNGVRTYTAKITLNDVEYSNSKEETINLLGHNWGEPTYEWNADNTECIATRVCCNDSNHMESETSSSKATIIQNQTCTNTELTNYEVTFTNSVFCKQIKENVQTKEAFTHDYVFLDIIWTEYTAKAIYVCSYDENHIEVHNCVVTSELTLAPTCIEEGNRKYTATYEEYTSIKNEILPKDQSNHAIVLHNAQVPTCTEIGWESYDTCSRCAYTTYVEKKALGHNYDVDNIVWTWTEYSSCIAKISCKREGCSHYEEKDATITSEVTLAATCIATGTKVYTAKITFKGDEYTSIKNEILPIDSNNHAIVLHNAKSPTCTEIGWESYDTCSRCAYTTYVEKKALGHDWGEPTYEWNADNTKCIATRICGNDVNHIESETSLSKSTIIQNQTCTNTELTNYEVTFTNSVFCKQIKENVQTKAALNHNYVFSEIVWTEYTAKAKYVCSHDENHIEEHNCIVTSELTPAPTCIEEGNRKYTATYDEYTSIKNEILPIDSNNHAIVLHNAKSPTCTEIGWESYDTCSRCAYTTYVEKKALGHDYKDGVCTRCKDLQTKGLSFEECTVNDVYGYGVSIGTANGEIYIPSEYNNKPVIKILDFANSSITSITIPSSIKTINSGSFSGCIYLTSMVIPFVGERAGVKSSDTYQYPFGYIFGTSSYEGGTAVKQYYYGSSTNSGSATTSTFYIPSSLKSVTLTGGNILFGAFNHCSMFTSISLSNSVISIGESAFSGCTGLESITIGTGVRSIGSGAFYDCSALSSITIPDSVTSDIGTETFRFCTGLKSIIIGSGVTGVGESAFGGCSSLTSIILPNNVKTIGETAFINCTSLEDVTIGDGVSSIGEMAFAQCSGLTSVTMGNNVTTIETYAFYFCTKLTNITISNKVNRFEFGAFYRCSALKSINIPESVTYLGSGAFENCTALTSVYITNLVKWCEIMFEDCCSNPLFYAHDLYLNEILVTNLVIPNSVTSIGNNMFCKCSATSISMGNGVTSIGNEAFYGCSALKSITIPSSVTSIGYGAFSGCSSLDNITFEDTSTWYYTDNSTSWKNKTGGTTINVTNTSTNATNLISTYYNYYWYKK